MRSRGGPRFASVVFTLIVALAIGGIAWGATHNKSSGHGVGSAKDQQAARAVLQTGLQFPAGISRDPSFTACGFTADACLTGSTSIATTLTALTTAVRAAGGSLQSGCTAIVTSTGTASAAGPRFTCAVQGELRHAAVFFLLGDGWLLPGNPTPRTAILVTVVGSATPTHQTGVPATAASAKALLPTTWASQQQPCAGAPSAAASTSASAAASPSTTASASPSTAATSAAASAAPPSAPLLLTAPPLPACSTTAITFNVSVHLALSDAALQLEKLALSNGFRLDGRPCIAGSTATSCGVWGERISSGMQELFVATLADDGRGDTVGTLSVTAQSAAPQS